LSRTFYPFFSINELETNHPRCSKQRVPTAEVRFIIQSCLSTCKETWPTCNSPHTKSIHILDDDSLLNIFHLYRPFLLGEDQNVNICLRGGAEWVGERWWYRLAHVCRRWRNLILGSAPYLRLCLVCTYGTPVADMLAHSPPLPLVIDYHDHDITAEDEESISLALEHRERVRRIRLTIPVPKLQKLIMAIDGEYPLLEYLILGDLRKEKRTVLILFPKHLRHHIYATWRSTVQFRYDSNYLRLPLASSNSVLHYTTHPLTSSRLFCSSRFH
jgi:hypothetical protein